MRASLVPTRATLNIYYILDYPFHLLAIILQLIDVLEEALLVRMRATLNIY